MNTADALVKSIFQMDSLNDCSLESLQALADQYPYFTPAQFLVAKKLQGVDHSKYSGQLQKLSLHFNNPLWLDFLLNGYQISPVVPVKDAPDFQPMETNEHKQETLVLNDARVPEETEAREQEPMVKPEEAFSPPPLTESQNDDAVVASILVDNSGPDETEPDAASPEEAQANADNISIPVRLPDLHQPASEAAISFEPYHTVDYFASQGIRFIQEEKPADRFGQQLKSFTEWLKAMKKLPETPPAQPQDPKTEEKVQQLANHSIDEEDVVTEAMAEVWLKQGNKEKAVDVYEKLSLLNPSKSAYFASLIADLKNS